MAGDNSTDFDDGAKATTQAAQLLDSGWLLASKAVEFLFRVNCAIIGIGVVGTAANAVVLYALIVHNARETKKRVVNWLIINQNLIDLCCCIAVVICVSVKISNIHLTGVLGYLLCAILINENAALCFINASVVNLVTITIERYLKIVHPFWSKKNLKHWMIYGAIVFSWIAGILAAGPMGFATSFVVDGRCMSFELYWTNAEIKVGYGIWHFLFFFSIPMIMFVYCYGRIVMVMRKQMRVMAGHNAEGSAQNASQAQSKRIKWNVIKTMIIVTAFFIVCWFPPNVYILAIKPLDTNELAIGYIVVFFLPYINISVNPFIYSAKHEGVKRLLARMIGCRRRDDVATLAGTAAE